MYVHQLLAQKKSKNGSQDPHIRHLIPETFPTTDQLSAGHHYILAFIFSLIVASVVSHVYWDLVASSLRSKTELILVHLPFSLLHAYLVFLLVLSAFTAFGVDRADHKAGPITQALVIIALLLLASLVDPPHRFLMKNWLILCWCGQYWGRLHSTQ
jgi:hypothetical protein